MIPFGRRHAGHPDGSTEDAWLSYVCGHCGEKVSGFVLATIGDPATSLPALWLQCTACHQGTFRKAEGQFFPSALPGPTLQGVPEPVAAAYEEARRCLTVNAYTAAETMCRKILMHVAVDKGAKERKSFAFYLEFLSKKGYVTPPMERWVGLIRDHGNEANHKLEAPSKDRAEGTLNFTAQLLRSVYEMEHLANQYAPVKKPESQ